MARAQNSTGTEKAAILLLSLGEEEAANVLKHMDAREVQAVGAAMAQLEGLSRERMAEVVEIFVTEVDQQGPHAAGTHDYVKRVLTSSLGRQRGEMMLERILEAPESGAGIDALRWMEPRAVAQLVGTEHPQVVALVLAQLDATQAGAVMALLPESIRPEVTVRIAQLEELPQSAIRELDQMVETRATEGAPPPLRKMGGARTVAAMLNAMDKQASSAILLQVADEDSVLHQRIKELLFVFDNLLEVDDRGIQAILRDVGSDALALALRGADADVQEKIFRNMSKRAAEILRDDMEARGPVKLSEVEAAQREIVAIAQKLAEEGTIVLGRAAADYV